MNSSGCNNYNAGDARISLMMKIDEKSTVQINLWEKIKILFPQNKKSDAWQKLYHLIHHAKDGDKLDAFNKLKHLSSPENKDFFTKEIHCDDVLFFVGKDNVGQSSLQKLINVSDQTTLHSMSVSEQSFFLKILDTVWEKKWLYSDSSSNAISGRVFWDCGDELISLYRPQDDIESPGAEGVSTKFLDYKEEQLLRNLHYDRGMRLDFQFSSIGYQKIDSVVEFTMIHPLMNYLLLSDAEYYYGASSNTDLNSEKLNAMNNIYHDYNYNKSEIDKVLNKVYDIHGGTLNICFTDQIVASSYTGNEYLIQPTHDSRVLSEPLDTIFHKWIGSDK